jgi:hypothetical protein
MERKKIERKMKNRKKKKKTQEKKNRMKKKKNRTADVYCFILLTRAFNEKHFHPKMIK